MLSHQHRDRQEDFSMTIKASAESTDRNIRRKTRRKYSAEEKIRIVLEGLRGDLTIAELCRREGLSENLYFRWSKDFLEAGKSRLIGDTKREANSKQVKSLRQENEQLKQLVAELALKNKVLTPALAGGAREKSLLGTDTA
jgi:transposase